jgi:hypothetical protein
VAGAGSAEGHERPTFRHGRSSCRLQAFFGDESGGQRSVSRLEHSIVPLLFVPKPGHDMLLQDLGGLNRTGDRALAGDS